MHICTWIATAAELCLWCMLAQVAACLQQATPQEVTAVQRSLANAEAKAAAAEAAAAAAEQAASWAHHTSGQAFSVTSSADLSQNGFAATEQHVYGAENSDYHLHVQPAVPNAELMAAQQASTLAVDMSVSESIMQQQQQLPYIPAPADMQQQCRGQVVSTQDHPGPQAYLTTSNRHPQQVQLQQQQMHSQHQQMQYSNQQQHLSQDSMHAAQHMVSTQPAPGMLAAPRDLLGRPVPAAAASPGACAGVATAALSTSQSQLQGQPAHNLSGAALMAGTNVQPQVPQSQNGQATTSADDSSAPAGSSCASAAAMAAASAAAAGDASSQARHLTVLVHRLQSRPAEDVLAELAACTGVLSSQAWEANFSKVCALDQAHLQFNVPIWSFNRAVSGFRSLKHSYGNCFVPCRLCVGSAGTTHVQHGIEYTITVCGVVVQANKGNL